MFFKSRKSKMCIMGIKCKILLCARCALSAECILYGAVSYTLTDVNVTCPSVFRCSMEVQFGATVWFCESCLSASAILDFDILDSATLYFIVMRHTIGQMLTWWVLVIFNVLWRSNLEQQPDFDWAFLSEGDWEDYFWQWDFGLCPIMLNVTESNTLAGIDVTCPRVFRRSKVVLFGATAWYWVCCFIRKCSFWLWDFRLFRFVMRLQVCAVSNGGNRWVTWSECGVVGVVVVL